MVENDDDIRSYIAFREKDLNSDRPLYAWFTDDPSVKPDSPTMARLASIANEPTTPDRVPRKNPTFDRIKQDEKDKVSCLCLCCSNN